MRESRRIGLLHDNLEKSLEERVDARGNGLYVGHRLRNTTRLDSDVVFELQTFPQHVPHPFLDRYGRIGARILTAKGMARFLAGRDARAGFDLHAVGRRDGPPSFFDPLRDGHSARELFRQDAGISRAVSGRFSFLFGCSPRPTQCWADRSTFRRISR